MWDCITVTVLLWGSTATDFRNYSPVSIGIFSHGSCVAAGVAMSVGVGLHLWSRLEYISTTI